jgi:hypothetical protein
MWRYLSVVISLIATSSCFASGDPENAALQSLLEQYNSVVAQQPELQQDDMDLYNALVQDVQIAFAEFSATQTANKPLSAFWYWIYKRNLDALVQFGERKLKKKQYNKSKCPLFGAIGSKKSNCRGFPISSKSAKEKNYVCSIGYKDTTDRGPIWRNHE